MTNSNNSNYEVVAKYIKDISFEIPDPDCFIDAAQSFFAKPEDIFQNNNRCIDNHANSKGNAGHRDDVQRPAQKCHGDKSAND